MCGRRVVVILFGFAVSVAAIEASLRFAFGLGSPLLYSGHRTIEYLYQPNQSLTRFGRTFVTNQFGTRSDPVELPKPDDEFRVSVIGDSIVDGGTRISQSDTAVYLAELALKERFSTQAISVENISLGSWGPGNYLEFIREYGAFEPDIVVVVISSHDYYDVPDFSALDGCDQPERPFATALAELVQCFMLPLLTEGSNESVPTAIQPVADSGAALTELLGSFRDRAIKLHVIQHWDQTEITRGTPHDGHRQINAIANKWATSVIQLGSYLQSRTDSDRDLFIDNLHLGQAGHRILSERIVDLASAVLEARVDPVQN